MAARTGRGGGTAVRWAYGVIVALCAALAVLVHHEVPSTGLSPMSGMSHVLPAGTSPDRHASPDAAQPSRADTATHPPHDGACSASGTQHCAAAGVNSLHLAVPAHSTLPTPATPAPTLSRHAPGAVVSRAPPDLSVLSRLRI
ncbi:hypothetical protein [Streptomyces sp. NPDC006739]|uniref:hypothetical protein n=1 Tax=Streptomyces sp. NPDC006739 TaxID=3364763 RepID=UPI0036C3840E